jgi:hypothetical protein
MSNLAYGNAEVLCFGCMYSRAVLARWSNPDYRQPWKRRLPRSLAIFSTPRHLLSRHLYLYISSIQLTTKTTGRQSSPTTCSLLS